MNIINVFDRRVHILTHTSKWIRSTLHWVGVREMACFFDTRSRRRGAVHVGGCEASDAAGGEREERERDVNQKSYFFFFLN